jgi:hypothetical protein
VPDGPAPASKADPEADAFARPRGVRPRVRGHGVFDYTFAKAPTDWRVAGGVWGIAPRWQSDPGKTFFCGWLDPQSDEKAVVIWNKRGFPGEVTVELHVGPKMDQQRGRRYEYVRDFNITIAADGKHLTSGYTFTCGGFSDTRSAILRGREVLAESTGLNARIPRDTMTTGRKWWYLRAVRAGGSLAFDVECRGVKLVRLRCVDPNPLPGDRVAIWTYDCGIVVGRVRISGLPGKLVEGPDFEAPERTRTYYDAEQRPSD